MAFCIKGNRTPKARGFAKQIHKEANKVHQGCTLRAEVRFPQGTDLESQFMCRKIVSNPEGEGICEANPQGSKTKAYAFVSRRFDSPRGPPGRWTVQGRTPKASVSLTGCTYRFPWGIGPEILHIESIKPHRQGDIRKFSASVVTTPDDSARIGAQPHLQRRKKPAGLPPVSFSMPCDIQTWIPLGNMNAV
jgi:hypothetical protein